MAELTARLSRIEDPLAGQCGQGHSLTVIAGTAVVVSAVWGFFFVRELSVRDERIKLIQEFQGQEKISEYMRKIDKNIAKLSLATSVDPIDGRVALGNGLSGPSDVTKILMEIGSLIEKKQYDLVDAKLAQIEQLYPDFPGVIAVRFDIARNRGHLEDAERYGKQLFNTLPNDKRVVPAMLFVAERSLARKETGKAEKLVLTAISLDPDNSELVQKFEDVFHYRPTPK